MKRLRGLRSRHIEHTPYHYLLGLLILFLVGYPYFVGSDLGREALGAFVMAVLVLGVFSGTRTKLLRAIAIGLAAPAFVLQILYLSGRDEVTFFMAGISAALVLIFTLANVLAYVLRRGPVTEDRIAAAVCAYLLTGLLWAGFYSFTDVLVPESFIALGGGVRKGHFYEFVYFSFTTLTTTGYGDIAPASFHARSLANAEQLVGVFYIALLIARLTGLYQSSRAAKADE
ncbi:MAG: potassium channel family protein [Alphaproteobacteria bacterium]